MRADSLFDFSSSDTPTMDTSTPPLRLWGTALLSVLILSGCSLLKETRESIDEDIATTDTLREQMRERSEPFAVLTHARARIAGEEIRLKEEKEILPPLFDERVTYVTSGQTLQETLETVSRQVNMPIWLTEFVSDKESVGKNSSSSNNDDERGRVTIQIHYDGPLRGLLDQLAQSARLHWRYYEGRVEFFLYETRHFYVNLPMGVREIKSSISSSASGGGGGGEGGGGGSGDTGSLSVEMEGMKVDPYNVITRAIAAILMEDDGQTDVLGNGESDIEINELASGGSSGSSSNNDEKRGASRVVVAPEMAMITVTAQPTSLDRVADYIEQVNRRFSRNITIDLKIYDVVLTDAVGVGFSLDSLAHRIKDFGLALVGSNVGSANIVRPTAGDPRFGSGFAMSAIARALESFGRTSLVTSGQVIAVNGQPAPLQIGREQGYIARVEVRESESLGSTRVTTTPVTERVSTGLTANFLPQMLTDNRILLQYQLTSRNVTFTDRVITSGSGTTAVSYTIQLPDVSSQTQQQQAFVRDGEAIVLFGYEESRTGYSGDRSAPINANRNGQKGRTLRVIVMQIFGGGPNGNAYM